MNRPAGGLRRPPNGWPPLSEKRTRGVRTGTTGRLSGNGRRLTCRPPNWRRRGRRFGRNCVTGDDGQPAGRATRWSVPNSRMTNGDGAPDSTNSPPGRIIPGFPPNRVAVGRGYGRWISPVRLVCVPLRRAAFPRSSVICPFRLSPSATSPPPRPPRSNPVGFPSLL